MEAATMKQDGRIGEISGPGKTRRRRAYQKGWTVREGRGEAVQGSSAATGKVAGMEVFSGLRSAERQFRCDAQGGSVGPARLFENKGGIAHHVAGHAVALYHGNIHGVLSVGIAVV